MRKTIFKLSNNIHNSNAAGGGITRVTGAKSSITTNRGAENFTLCERREAEVKWFSIWTVKRRPISSAHDKVFFLNFIFRQVTFWWKYFFHSGFHHSYSFSTLLLPPSTPRNHRRMKLCSSPSPSFFFPQNYFTRWLLDWWMIAANKRRTKDDIRRKFNIQFGKTFLVVRALKVD